MEGPAELCRGCVGWVGAVHAGPGRCSGEGLDVHRGRWTVVLIGERDWVIDKAGKDQQNAR